MEVFHGWWGRDATLAFNQGLSFVPEAEEQLCLLLEALHDLVDVRAYVFVTSGSPGPISNLALSHQHVIAAVAVGDFTLNSENFIVQELALFKTMLSVALLLLLQLLLVHARPVRLWCHIRLNLGHLWFAVPQPLVEGV